MSEKREVMIKVENLKKVFSGRTVLNNVNLDIYRGETMVIMGGSGCGKSTLLRHIIGAMKPDEGRVIFMGRDMNTLDADGLDEIRKKFGMLFQSAALFDSMNVGNNIALPLKEHTHLDSKIINIIVKMKLELVGLRGFENLMPSQLSGGMRKRVGLARAIVMDPEVVFYDEPTAGLDAASRRALWKYLREVRERSDTTVFLTTHYLEEAEDCDRVCIIAQGRVVALGSPSEVKATVAQAHTPSLEDAYLAIVEREG